MNLDIAIFYHTDNYIVSYLHVNIYGCKLMQLRK